MTNIANRGSAADAVTIPLFTTQISKETCDFIDKEFFPFFEKWKKNHSTSEIPLTTFKNHLNTYSQKHQIAPIVRNELEEIFDKADHDGNGSINLDEFKKMLVNRHKPLDKEKASIVVKILESIVRPVACESDKKNMDLSLMFSRFPPPIFIISISIAQAIIFAYNVEACKGDMDLVQKEVSSSVLIFNPNKKYQLWRLITHLFIYSRTAHFAKNIVFQLIIGTLLEVVNCSIKHKFKFTRFLIPLAFLFGVLTGALGASVIHPTVYILGSSAGIYSICMVYCIYYYKNFGDIKIYYPIVVPFFAQVIYEVVSLAFESNGEKSSGWCHVFGAVSGLLVGTCVIREKTENRYSTRAIFGLVAHLILIVILLIFYFRS